MAARRTWQQTTRLKESSEIAIQGVENAADLTNGKEVMSAFLKILVERWRKNLVKHRIGHEGDLDDSFNTRTSATRNTLKGSANFNYYGRFVDMGVGKGVKLSETGGKFTLTRSRKGARGRKPKPWFSGTWAYEKQRLAEVYQQYIADEILNHTDAALSTEVKIKL